MHFQISHKANSVAVAADLYQPSKSGNYKAAIGGVALMLVSANPVPTFALETVVSSFSHINPVRINMEDQKVNMNQQCLVLPLRNDLRISKNYDTLKESFCMHFSKDKKNFEKYFPMFQGIANSLKSLYIKKAFVDVNKNKGLVDFSINLGNHLVLTIGKSLETFTDDYVMFTLSYQGELEVADTLPLPELIKRVNNIQTELMEK